MMPGFPFVTIYKFGKCMMPSVLKICSDFKYSKHADFKFSSSYVCMYIRGVQRETEQNWGSFQHKTIKTIDWMLRRCEYTSHSSLI